jgi:tetratricopeptide (TPR) repeat protein
MNGTTTYLVDGSTARLRNRERRRELARASSLLDQLRDHLMRFKEEGEPPEFIAEGLGLLYPFERRRRERREEEAKREKEAAKRQKLKSQQVARQQAQQQQNSEAWSAWFHGELTRADELLWKTGRCFVGRSPQITGFIPRIVSLLAFAVVLAQDATAQETPLPNAEAYYNRGIAYSKNGDSVALDRAIADYTQTIQLDPKFVEAYVNRGYAYSEKGEYDRAVADYTQAIQLDPKFVDAYVNRARAYRLKGDIDRAIADYTQVIQLNPKFAPAYYNRGIAYRMKGDTDRAIADYRQAIKLFPRFNDCKWHICVIP